MNMITVSEYDPSTGLFTGVTYSGREDMIALQYKPGMNYAEGKWEKDLYSIDPQGNLVHPTAEAEANYATDVPWGGKNWDRGLGQWVAPAVPQEVDLARRKQRWKDQIEKLEAKQGRAVREAVLGKPGAMARLQALEEDIVDLRARINAEN